MVVNDDRNRKLEAYVGHHSGFALPPGERVHLLVFGVLTFSLWEKKKMTSPEISVPKQCALE